MTALIVFAKAPVPGRVKTRLVPCLSDAAAARLHELMVRRTVDRARAAGIGAVELCCAPDASHATFQSMVDAFGLTCTVQGDGDLGARMNRALERGIATQGRAIVIGTDCPLLDAAYLRAADAALTGGTDVVIGPAEDGGYVLIGATRAVPALFEAMPWGTEQVLEQTRQRIGRCGLRARELATLWDVDRPADFERLALADEALARACLTGQAAADDGPKRTRPLMEGTW